MTKANKSDLPKEYQEIPDGQMTFFDRGGHHIYKGKNDLPTTNINLLDDWDWSNKRLPWQYSSSSHEKLNWICHICYKTWKASIDARNRGTGCPHCTKNVSMPELVLAEYFVANNINIDEQVKLGKFKGDIVVDNILIEYNGSAFHSILIDERRIIEAINYGINTIIIISEIHDNTDCIEIENNKILNILVYNIKYHCRKNSSISNFDRLLHVLDNLINSRTNVKTIGMIDTQKFIDNAYKNKGIARNNILKLGDDIMKEYCYQLNPNPQTVYIGSVKKVKWKCSKCGSIYECSPLNKKRGDMCPVCSNHVFISGTNDLLTKNPSIAAELIGENPSDIFYNSTKKVKWLCSSCNCIWESRVKDRTVLDASCKVCGYTLLYKDRTKIYDFNSISTKYNVEHFYYNNTIIPGITSEVELLKYIISRMYNTKFRNILIENKYVIDNTDNTYYINKELIVSRVKAKQKKSRLYEMMGEDVNIIKIKPEEDYYDRA